MVARGRRSRPVESRLPLFGSAGYLDESGVASDSEVESYVVLRAKKTRGGGRGVPFFHPGKALTPTVTEAVVDRAAVRETHAERGGLRSRRGGRGLARGRPRMA